MTQAILQYGMYLVILVVLAIPLGRYMAVSYTHLDVYKRQEYSGTPLDKSPYPLIEKPHAMSHDPMTYFGVPHFFGARLADEPLCWLNLLRTKVRQAERQAVAAFGEKRADLVEELNLLSSYVYCCMCRYRAETEARP